MPSPPSSFVSETDVARPIFIGMVFSVFLNGITSIQALIFFCAKGRGLVMQKIAVVLLLSLDTIHTVFVAHAVYYYTIENPLNDTTSIPIAVWSIAAQLSVHLLVVPLIQSLYLIRLWNLTPRHRQWIPIILILLVVINIVLGLDLGINLNAIKTLPELHNSFKLGCVTLSSFFITDMIVGGALIHALALSKLNLRWTDSSFTMVLAYLINTGVIAGLLSIAGIIFFVVPSNTTIFLAVKSVQLKLHLNSFMGMLNARCYLQRDSEYHHQIEGGDNASAAPSVNSESQHTSFTASSPERSGTPTKLVSPTINEVGLPFFVHSTSRLDARIDGSQFKAVKVSVEHEAISSGI